MLGSDLAILVHEGQKEDERQLACGKGTYILVEISNRF